VVETQVLRSPDISNLLRLVDEFVTVNAAVASPDELVTAVIDAVVDSKIFKAFAALAGIDVSAVSDSHGGMDAAKAQLRTYLGEPLMNLVGIYVHSVDEPTCAARWLCDFAGSVHLQIQRDSTAFWMANIHRTGG
jgi:hypothetical protein